MLSLIGTFHRKESYYNEFESKKVLGPFQRFRKARRFIKTLRKILKVIFFFLVIWISDEVLRLLTLLPLPLEIIENRFELKGLT